MQTLEFTRDLKEIVDRMRVGELLALIGRWLAPVANQQQPLPDADKTLFSDLMFGSYAGYDALTKREGTRKILESLDAKDFYEPNRLRILVSSVSNLGLLSQIRGQPEVHALYEKLKSLKSLEITCRTILEAEKVGQIDPSKGIFQLELIQYADEEGIVPRRLVVFASSIDGLHADVALVLGLPGDTLTFKYFDSGSGLLVGIQCAKDIAGILNTLLTQWWDKVRFWRYDTFEKKMEAISKGLSVVDTVHQAIEKKTITGEAGEILKVKIFKQVDALIGVGATIPLGEGATVDQRQLLTELRNTKLLGTGEPSAAEGEDPTATKPA
jgi:hypothetical protein